VYSTTFLAIFIYFPCILGWTNHDKPITPPAPPLPFPNRAQWLFLPLPEIPAALGETWPSAGTGAKRVAGEFEKDVPPKGVDCRHLVGGFKHGFYFP